MKKRKEVQLEQDIIDKLQKLAEAENRSLKSFMEKVLIDVTKKKKI